jgi:uncharacterized membrane protein
MGMVLLSIDLWIFPERLSLFSLGFVSAALIAFGGTVMSNSSLKTVSISLLMGGLWLFLFVLPLSMMPFPPEIASLAVSFLSLLPILIVGGYEKWRKSKRNIEREKDEVSVS